MAKSRSRKFWEKKPRQCQLRQTARVFLIRKGRTNFSNLKMYKSSQAQVPTLNLNFSRYQIRLIS